MAAAGAAGGDYDEAVLLALEMLQRGTNVDGDGGADAQLRDGALRVAYSRLGPFGSGAVSSERLVDDLAAALIVPPGVLARFGYQLDRPIEPAEALAIAREAVAVAVQDFERYALQKEHAGANGQAGEAELTSKYRFVGLRHVLELPKVEFLVANIVTEGGTSVLAGPSGHGKSFLAIDLALCVATGEPFRGDRTVKRGLVAYIAAESFGGHGQRLAARLDYHGTEADPDSIPLHFLPAAPQLMEAGEVQSVLVAINELPEPPALIVIDTLSMTFIGGDEKDGHDVGRYVGGIQRLERATGAHVMTLHHTGWNQERERGHTALRAAVDTMILLNREDNLITMSCLKQRDAEPFADLHFELKSWRDSAILAPLVGRQRPRPHPLPATRQKALDALRAADDGGGISFTKWCETTGLAKATFNRVKEDLVSWGLIEKRGGKWATV